MRIKRFSSVVSILAVTAVFLSVPFILASQRSLRDRTDLQRDMDQGLSSLLTEDSELRRLRREAGRVPPGRVAWHFVARILFTPTGVDLIGYNTFIDGLPGPFFDGPAGERTAFFTTRLTPGSGQPFEAVTPGGDVAVTLISPGVKFDVFFDPSPNQDWSDPDTFSDGQLIGTFEESHFMGTRIGPASFNLFSADLVFSDAFTFQGMQQDLGRIVPFGVTINNYSGTPISFDPVTIPFTGSAVAIGPPGR